MLLYQVSFKAKKFLIVRNLTSHHISSPNMIFSPMQATHLGVQADAKASATATVTIALLCFQVYNGVLEHDT